MCSDINSTTPPYNEANNTSAFCNKALGRLFLAIVIQDQRDRVTLGDARDKEEYKGDDSEYEKHNDKDTPEEYDAGDKATQMSQDKLINGYWRFVVTGHMHPFKPNAMLMHQMI